MKHLFLRVMAALLALLLLVGLAPLVCAQEQEDFHAAYLCGYPDGTIRPEEILTREALAQALCRLMDEAYLEQPDTAGGRFLDVAPSRWSYRAVSTLANLKIMLADGQGRFHPTDGVTGQELALTFARIAASEAGEAAFGALAEGWRAQKITFSDENGWVMGLRDGVFCPDEPLTRAQFASIMNRILDRNPQSLDDLMIGMPLFSDNEDTQAWYFLAMQEAAAGHSYVRTDNGERWTALG